MKVFGDLLDQYEAATIPSERDVAYWHTELTITGLLVAAAWQAGAVALPEFETVRRWHGIEEESVGRGDAWIRLPADAWSTVEAKLCWSFNEIDESFRQATEDLMSLQPSDRGNAALALVYCVPQLPLGTGADAVRRLAHEVLTDAGLVVAYTTPNAAPDAEGHVHPGLIVVGRYFDWPQLATASPWRQK